MASDTTPKGKAKPKVYGQTLSQEYTNLLSKAADLSSKLKESKEESDNLERHVKRLMLEKAELNDKIEQLTDDVRKFEGLYDRAKGVAQALGRAVSILTTENKHG